MLQGVCGDRGWGWGAVRAIEDVSHLATVAPFKGGELAGRQKIPKKVHFLMYRLDRKRGVRQKYWTGQENCFFPNDLGQITHPLGFPLHLLQSAPADSADPSPVHQGLDSGGP